MICAALKRLQPMRVIVRLGTGGKRARRDDRHFTDDALARDFHNDTVGILDPPVARDELDRLVAVILDPDMIRPEPALFSRARLFGKIADRNAHRERSGRLRMGEEDGARAFLSALGHDPTVDVMRQRASAR